MIRFLPATIFHLTVLAAPAYGDSEMTREVCSKLGGVWTSSVRFPGSCTAKTEFVDCQFLRGSWTWDERKKEGRCRVSQSRTNFITECEGAGGKWGRFGAGIEHCFFAEKVEAAKRKCESSGGISGRMGKAQMEGCTRPTKDGGTPCSNKADCQIDCIYEGPHLAVGSPAIGICVRDDSPFGCRTTVDGGRIRGGKCVD
jgi:hypothetical protein